jgi:hypothetical protein
MARIACVAPGLPHHSPSVLIAASRCSSEPRIISFTAV